MKSGQGRMLECLKDHKEDLSAVCRNKIFQRQEEEASEPEKVQEKDYVLNRACKSMINQFCEDEQNVLKCLWKHRLHDGFEEKCLKIVHKRMATKGEGLFIFQLIFSLAVGIGCANLSGGSELILELNVRS